MARFISINAFGNSEKRIGPSNRNPELFISHNLFYMQDSTDSKCFCLKIRLEIKYNNIAMSKIYLDIPFI